MYRIAILAERDEERNAYVDQIAQFCHAKGLWPQIADYSDQEQFFESVQRAAPSNAVIALSGVAGLNAVEHLRALCPACGVIWYSDLDFSLQAFRLRANDFSLKPVSGERLRQGLTIWLENRSCLPTQRNDKTT